jgi:phosphoribosylformylglycinamidine synthase PurS subunit
MWLARIHVTLKPVVNDPQGLAVMGGLHQLGYAGVDSVRLGKYLEVRLAAPDRPAAESQVDEMCRRLLANPVIEDYRYTLDEIPDTVPAAPPH